MNIEIKIKRERANALLPTKAHEDDAAYDLYYSGPFDHWTLQPGEIHAFECGFATAIQPGYYAVVKDRSGNALNQHFHVLAGVIDSGYRGEWKVILVNLGKTPVRIAKDAKIAQFLIVPVLGADFKEAVDLPDSDRGVKGFGSSGS